MDGTRDCEGRDGRVSGRGGSVGGGEEVSDGGITGGTGGLSGGNKVEPVGGRGEYRGIAVWIESSSGVGKGLGKLAAVAAMASGKGM